MLPRFVLLIMDTHEPEVRKFDVYQVFQLEECVGEVSRVRECPPSEETRLSVTSEQSPEAHRHGVHEKPVLRSAH